MRTAAQVIGSDAEGIVAERLRRAGWTVLGRNVRVGRAEIDILAIDDAFTAIVAIEVRWRRRRDYGLPEETVGRTKLARLRSAALTWRQGEPRSGPAQTLPVRVDIIAVEPGGRIRHHRGVA
jgi:putative endonuclease